jgi:hypothetical protein
MKRSIHQVGGAVASRGAKMATGEGTQEDGGKILPPKLPLDRSSLVVRAELSKNQCHNTAMHSWVASIQDRLDKTGLALVTLTDVPRFLRKSQRPEDMVKLLETQLGAKYQLHTYSYVSKVARWPADLRLGREFFRHVTCHPD